MGDIKINPKELRKKTTEELRQLLKELEMHLIRAGTSKNLGNKGFNIREERRNISRILTILKERENEHTRM